MAGDELAADKEINTFTCVLGHGSASFFADELNSTKKGSMSSKVYFARLKVCENTLSKIKRLFDAAGLRDLLHEDDLTAIKLHFGERGNDSFISPVHVRQVVEKIHSAGAHPFLTDTNTLYSGGRHNSVDHLTTAIEHGFGYAVTRAPLVIADGMCGANYREVTISGRHFDTVKIAGEILDSPSMIVLSHFKGHELAGFGGAIKNLAMGCASIAGKMDQHKGLHPRVNSRKCTGCGSCENACPCSAIVLQDNLSIIDHDQCIGCGECMAVCTTDAIGFNWDRDVVPFLEMMTEYAQGAVSGKEGRVGYMNFLMNITPDCDCVPWSDNAIVPDIGILASTDPVAIDHASYDLVNRQQGIRGSKLQTNFRPGEDKFRGASEHTRGEVQFHYGEEIGLGSIDYELIEI